MPRGRPSRTSVYDRLDEAIIDLNERLGGLPTPAEAEDIWAELWHQEAHHSTAIEGNTLVLAEVEQLLEEGRAVGDKELKEYMEVVGYGHAAKWVYGQALEPGGWSADQILTVQEVRTVHHQTMTPVWNVAPHPHASPTETPGNWRRHEIQAFPEGMKPPSFTELDALVADWVAEVNALSLDNRTPFPERLAKLHNQFERVHPFLDGNGRTGRLLLNLVLVRSGYPPAIIFKAQRTRYLTAMRRADSGQRRVRSDGRAVGKSHHRQSVQVRSTGDCRSRPPRPTGKPCQSGWVLGHSATKRRQPRTPPRAEVAERSLDELKELGRRIRAPKIQAWLTGRCGRPTRSSTPTISSAVRCPSSRTKTRSDPITPQRVRRGRPDFAGATPSRRLHRATRFGCAHRRGVLACPDIHATASISHVEETA